jgi:FAD/FMN-containing dehydrogenase
MGQKEIWKRCTRKSLPIHAKLITVKAIAELRTSLGEDAVSTDDEDLHAHGYSEWSSINIDKLPVAVAYPKTTEEVSQIAKVCYKYHMPMSKSWWAPRRRRTVT